MRCSRHLKVFYALALFLGISPAIDAIQNTAQLEYQLKPRSADAVFGETYYVDIYLKNNSGQAVTICKCNISGEVIYGELVDHESPMTVDRYHTSDAPEKADLVTVMPGSSIKFSWAGFGKEYFNKPGSWLLKIREKYMSITYGGSLRSWEGVLGSELLSVRVLAQ